ncbi:MAG: hypothetical protein HY231_24930, partial [Acidobacteria bacterium]|nr:hypothetical protein [Acidobacteriota bacterium]
TANAGKTFLIFASGPNGTSQNLTTLPAGTQGCPAGFLGNQQGIQVTFKCEPPPTPDNPPVSKDIAVVNACALDRTDAGGFVLTITGGNINANSTIKIGNTEVNKKKYKSPDSTKPAGYFTKVILKGQSLCGLLPGPIVITNNTTNGVPSSAFQCNKSCPSQN